MKRCIILSYCWNYLWYTTSCDIYVNVIVCLSFCREYNNINKWRVTVGMHDLDANEASRMDIPIRAIIKVSHVTSEYT